MRRIIPLVLIAIMIVPALVSAQLPASPVALRDAEAAPFVVRLDNVTVDDIAHAGGDVVRVDARLGFAVVRTADPDALARALGVRVQADGLAHAAGIAPGVPVDVPADPLAPAQYALAHLRMPEAWALESGNRSVRVAVLDSGLDFAHEDFAGVAVEAGTDYIDGGLVTGDPLGHGTHVAGVIVAARDNGVGIAGMADVTLHVIRVFSAQGSGSWSGIASAIVDAVDAGADIINFSGGGSETDDGLVMDAIRYARERDVLFVVAAGNTVRPDLSPAPHDCPWYPARRPEPFAIAASDPMLTAGFYSCRGDTVDIAAPGSVILSTVPGGYDVKHGTSMAAPAVAAAAALLKSHDPTLTAADLERVLVDTALDLGEPGWDREYGHGLVQPHAALLAVGAGT